MFAVFATLTAVLGHDDPGTAANIPSGLWTGHDSSFGARYDIAVNVYDGGELDFSYSVEGHEIFHCPKQPFSVRAQAPRVGGGWTVYYDPDGNTKVKGGFPNCLEYEGSIRNLFFINQFYKSGWRVTVEDDRAMGDHNESDFYLEHQSSSESELVAPALNSRIGTTH